MCKERKIVSMRTISKLLLMLLTVTAVLSGSTVWGMGPQYGANNNSKTPVTMEKTLDVFDYELTPVINAQGKDYKIYKELMKRAEEFAASWENQWDDLGCEYVGNCLATLAYDVNKDPEHVVYQYAQFCDQWAKSMQTLAGYKKGTAGYEICPEIYKVVGKKCYPFREHLTYVSYLENTKLVKHSRCQLK